MPPVRTCLLRALTSIALLGFALSEANAGDASAGRTVFSAQCVGCHAIKPGQVTMGSSLVGVVGRKAGSLAGFKYSAAMKASGLTWDEATLDGFLAAPAKKVPGTSMPLGLASPKDRADVIAYLATLVGEKGASTSIAPGGLASSATAIALTSKVSR